MNGLEDNGEAEGSKHFVCLGKIADFETDLNIELGFIIFLANPLRFLCPDDLTMC